MFTDFRDVEQASKTENGLMVVVRSKKERKKQGALED